MFLPKGKGLVLAGEGHGDIEVAVGTDAGSIK
jgi:hypothetical protein